jgi:hypothetical protein
MVGHATLFTSFAITWVHAFEITTCKSSWTILMDLALISVTFNIRVSLKLWVTNACRDMVSGTAEGIDTATLKWTWVPTIPVNTSFITRALGVSVTTS